MRLGLIARSDNTGLGQQTYGVYKYLEPSKTMVVDISQYNLNQQHPERYPDGIFIKGFPSNGDLRSFLEDLDCVFVAESPYNYQLYAIAKEMGVKVATQYNYEFFDWFVNPNYPVPDMLIAPTTWHYEEVDDFCIERGIEHTLLRVPNDYEMLRKRTIRKAKRFLHTAGKPAALDRNGTFSFIDASVKLRDLNIELIIHFQGDQGLKHQATNTIDDYRRYAEENNAPVQFIQKDFENYADVYELGDVLVLPRRYGGNCLPMNEALVTGMPVIMTDIEPNGDLLPFDWLVSARHKSTFTPRTTIEVYEASVVELADKIREFATMSEMDLLYQNRRALELGNELSWAKQAPIYQKELERLCSR